MHGEQASRALRGRVIDGDGHAVPFALVSAFDGWLPARSVGELLAAGRADAAGRFSLALGVEPLGAVLLAVRYSLESLADIERPDDRIQRQKAVCELWLAALEECDIEVTLELPVWVRCVVSSLPHDWEDAHLELEALRIQDETLHTAGVPIGGDGRFELLEGLPAGTYRVHVFVTMQEGEELSAVVADEVELRPGINELSLTFRDGGT